MDASPAAQLYSPEFLRDPYPTLAWLRQHAPVWYAEDRRAFIVTRHDDCLALLTDAARFADTSDDGAPLASQPAVHIQYRSLVNRAFTTTFVANLEPRIQLFADRLIDEFAGSGVADFMDAVAYPLPTLVLADLLGLTEAERPLFIAWADDYTRALGDFEPQVQARYQRSASELVAYFGYKLHERRGPASHDLLARLTSARIGDSQLSATDILSLCNQLMVAARDLATGLLGNSLYALLSHPDQWLRLRAEPSTLDSAIEECLRWDTPVLGQARTSLTDVSLRGVRIPAGGSVMVMLGSANRDPAVFAEPDRFDSRRQNAGQHLAFGRGIHFCLGAPLARLETRVVLRTLLDRLPNMRLAPDSPPVRRSPGQMLNLRAFRSLPIAFGTRADSSTRCAVITVEMNGLLGWAPRSQEYLKP